jgi:hypothetical protein
MSDQSASDHQVSDQLPAVSRETTPEEYRKDLESTLNLIDSLLENRPLLPGTSEYIQALDVLIRAVSETLATSAPNQEGELRGKRHRTALQSFLMQKVFFKQPNLVALLKSSKRGDEAEAWRRFSVYVKRFEANVWPRYRKAGRLPENPCYQYLCLAHLCLRGQVELPSSTGRLRDIVLGL